MTARALAALAAAAGPARSPRPPRPRRRSSRSGSFTTPTYAAAPASEPTRVFVTEKGGRVRLIVDGVVQATPFLDLTSITQSQRQRARAALDRLRARLRDVRQVLRLPDGAARRSGEIQVWEYRRSAANPNVADPATGAAADQHPAHPGRQPQRRHGPGRAGRQGLAGDRRRRRLRTTSSATPRTTRRGSASCCGWTRRRPPTVEQLARGPAQPVPVLVRARRDDRDRRRRPGPVGGDQRRPRRQLRLAVPRGRARLPHRPGLRRRRDRRPGGREEPQPGRLLRDRRRRRRPRPRPADAQRPLHLRRQLQLGAALGRTSRRRPATPPRA